MEPLKLYMLLLGCTLPGRHTEQHDVFFGIARKVSDLVPDMKAFWPEAGDKLHVDGWREVNRVGNYDIAIVSRDEAIENAEQLYFLNLGGYKPGEMEEFHYKMLRVSKDIGAAIREAKETAFYKHTTFDTATSHVDDKYGVDVDDIVPVKDILPATIRAQYQLKITPAEASAQEDELFLGYFQLHKL
ncbi:DUF1543 domain-containing protein [Chitinophaga qingshengii]|uniref:DUF1543 domain-containing protein n=1 Tax=Chitinophaga qingshengii TaxID=1569794 RepID=A0ABR7TPE0_9BACT|nr:DUF1543 domain-containing protein [Chitinophaga qingshengii]MBC9932342.1 DUF1543 domain-containing protein [Chitinophaga qingshengii]